MGEPTAKTMNGRKDPPGSASADEVKSAAAGQARPPYTPRAMLIRLRATTHTPRLWFEVLLIGFSYWLYSQIRNAVPEQKGIALRHARSIWSFEGSLGLAIEHGVNHAVNSVTWVIVGMNYYYATLHFIITISVLVWLYVFHPDRYGPPRLVLFMTTWLALVGFWAYPLAPPRLMNGAGFIDTVQTHHTWGSMSQGSLAHVSNQYAAMPSMHIGWSLWCGITVATLAKPLWMRIIALLYPVFTLSVIISTGNHFWMDAVGGALCLGVGYAVVWLVYGRWVYHLPQVPQPVPAT
jgi:hypothetical protein